MSFSTFVLLLDLSPETALIDYSLAPLGMRRDIAMLGLLHKIQLGVAPQPLLDMFRSSPQNLASYGFSSTRRWYSYQLHEPVEVSHPFIINRSAYGLIRIYNELPNHIVSARSAKVFQRRLQNCAKEAAKNNASNWQLMFHASA